MGTDTGDAPSSRWARLRRQWDARLQPGEQVGEQRLAGDFRPRLVARDAHKQLFAGGAEAVVPRQPQHLAGRQGVDLLDRICLLYTSRCV